MKFGGSSVASAAAIEWVAGIVKEHLEEQPVVVVSAMGKTTDRLMEAFHYAARGSAYSAWRRLEDLRQYHYQETQRLLGGAAREFIERRLASQFRELHAALIELEEGKKGTPDIKDEVLSYGERLSSEIVAAAFDRAGIAARHLDAREVIVTDEQFNAATPLYWETYARLRRAPQLRERDATVVLGGFIGATRDGKTTTLGRGGSDLTASLVGAGISASEIQIWTDVDGMLTCDPRVLHGGYRLRSLSYDEAEELARCGAKVLCANTVAPAVRQAIPITIRNSRRPEIEGTRICATAARKPGTVKAIACKTGVTVVHLFTAEPGILSSITDGLNNLFERRQVKIELAQARPDGVSFAVESSPALPELLRDVDASVRIRVEEESAILTLVGEGIASQASTLERVSAAFGKEIPVRMIAQGAPRSVRLAIPEAKLEIATEKLHREFFRAADAQIFAATPESNQRTFVAREAADTDWSGAAVLAPDYFPSAS